jgi:lipopolysaccharide transport system permease protein
MKKKIETFNLLRLLWNGRNKVLVGVMSDVRQRYTGSVFGSFWIFVFPFLQLSIYAALYSIVFKIRPSGLTEMGYVVLVFSGFVSLMAFNEVVFASTGSLTSNKNLLLNTVFTAELIPLRAALSSHITSLVGLVITIILGFSFGNLNWKMVLLIPFFWIFLLMFSMGIGWILSLISLISKDIQHALSLITMLLFVFSPFAYTPEMVPASLKFIIYLNPLSYFVLTFQQIICYGVWPDPIIAGVAILLGLFSFFIGLTIFAKAKLLLDYI